MKRIVALVVSALAWLSASAVVTYVPESRGIVLVDSVPSLAAGACTYGTSPAQMVRSTGAIYVCIDNGASDAYVLKNESGGGTPAGSPADVQVNVGGAFGTVPNFTANSTTGDITLGASGASNQWLVLNGDAAANTVCDGPGGITSNSRIYINRPSTAAPATEISFCRDAHQRWAIGEDTADDRPRSFFAIWSDNAGFDNSDNLVSSDVFAIAPAGIGTGAQDGPKFFYGSGMSVPSDFDTGYYHTFFGDTKRTSGDLRTALFKYSTNTPSGTALDSGGVDIMATGTNRDHLRLIQYQNHNRADIVFGDLGAGSTEYWRLGSDLAAQNLQNFGLYDYDANRWSWFTNATGVGILKNNPATALDVNGTATATAFVGPLTGNASSATTLSDGDKGDVSVSSGTFAVDADAVGMTELSDVTLTTPATGAVLIKSAGDWIDGAVDLADADAVTGTLADANVSDTITVGASGSVNDSALSANVTKLGSSISEGELALTDVTTANASVSAHGFLQKLPGGTTTFLRGDGTFATPSGSGDVVGPASATDNALARFDTTTGKLLQNSSVTVSDTGSVTAPSGQSVAVTSGCSMDTDVDCPAATSTGGAIVLKESSTAGTDTYTLAVQDSGGIVPSGANTGGSFTAATNVCLLHLSGRIPDECVGDGSDAAGSGNSFETMNAPSGTDPVADSSTDTLNWTATAPVTITGDSTTDTLTVAVGSAAAGTLGVIELDTDLSGTATAPTIADNAVDGTDIALGSDTTGDIMYYDGTDWVRLAAPAVGNFLRSNGTTTAPSWQSSNSQGFLASGSITCASASDGGKFMQGSGAASSIIDYCTAAGTTKHTLVNLAGSQTLSGAKTFSGGISVSGGIFWSSVSSTFSGGVTISTTNLSMGGDWNLSHFDFSGQHVWLDQLNGRLRYKSSGAPSSQTDGPYFRLSSDRDAECFTLYDTNGLADGNDIPSVWRAPVAVTIVEVWAECDAGTPSINLQRDDGTPADVLSSNLTPTTSGATGTIAGAEDNFADGDRLDFVMVSASTAKRINVCVEYTYD